MNIDDLRKKLINKTDIEKLNSLGKGATILHMGDRCCYDGDCFVRIDTGEGFIYEKFETRRIDISQEQAKEALLSKHPFYAIETNYTNNNASHLFNNVSEFMNEFGNVDIDLNLVYRFDVTEYDEDKFYNDFPEGTFKPCNDGLHRLIQITFIVQHKAIYMPCIIKSITDKDYIPLYKFLQKAYWRLTESWKGFKPYSYIKTLIIKRNELRKQIISASDYDKKILRIQISQIDMMIDSIHGSYAKKR